MDVYNLHYYKINIHFLRLVGAWFLQSTLSKVPGTVVFSTAVIICFGTQFIFLHNRQWSVKTLLEVCPQIFACWIILIKFLTCHWNAKKVEIFYAQISKNWKLCIVQKEVEIMAEYAEKGRQLTVYYMYSIIVLVIVFFSVSVLPQILDLINPLNESRPYIYPYPGHYLIDMEKYYFYVVLHMLYTVAVGMTVILCNDTLFMMLIQHTCALFAVLGYRLKHLFPAEDDLKNIRTSVVNEICVRNTILAIKSHQRALEFAQLIESSFSTSLLIQFGFWILCLTTTLLQVMLVFEDESAEGMRYLAFAIGQLFHILCVCYPGQELTNHSNEVSYNAIAGEWYKMPTKTQKMLVLLLRKSLEPSYVTAGKFFIFGLESFTTVVQSSLSYLMFISSMS